MSNKLSSIIKSSILSVAILLTGGAWAATGFGMTNPVTGETENYTWKFVGTDTWNGTQYWQNSDSTPPVGVPAKSGDSSWSGSDDQWLPILFDGNTIQINAWMLVEGWNLRMGLYNGANITLNRLVKLQSGVATWFTVDENSTLTIAGMDNNKLEGSNPLCLYSARANGITWTPALSNSAIGDGVQMPLHYYLAGDGTVAFTGGITLTSAQVIKRADVTLSEATSSKTVRSKTLVSFASTSTSTFSADAETTIKVKNSDGTALKDVNLTSVTATDTTLTTAGNVGDCELVQTTTGVVLYYVDYAKTYKPSININFTDSGSGLTTSADVGLGDYAIPGTSWNNLAGNNGSLSALNAADSSGATFATAASVAITEARGSYSCSSLTSASDLRHGYIDESTSGLTPTITVSGIPYEKYRVIVYTATDAANKTFGCLAINGKNYTYSNGNVIEGTDAWGASGAQNTAEPIAEGVNVLVSPVTLGSTLTVVGHRNGNDTRGCIAAVQIVEYVPEVTENDLVIPLMQASTTYTVSEAKTLSGTVYVVGSGTLTLDGSAKITAAIIDVAKDVILNINSDRLDATTFTGLGTVVYPDNTVPSGDKGFATSATWQGTVWLKNLTTDTGKPGIKFDPNAYGNNSSRVKLSGVTCYFTDASNKATTRPTIELEDENSTAALTIGNGFDAQTYIFRALAGSGTLAGTGVTDGQGSKHKLIINDVSNYTGNISIGRRTLLVISGESAPTEFANLAEVSSRYGIIYLGNGVSATVDSAAAWTTAENGAIYVAQGGELAFSTASSITNKVKGAGTLVRSGISNHGAIGTILGLNDSENWTGVMEFRNCNMALWNAKDYGNSASTVRLNGTTSYLYTGENKHNVGTIDIGANGWTIDGAYSANTFTIPAKLTGTGRITISTTGTGNKTFAFTGDTSEFRGDTAFSSAENTRILFGTSTARDFVANSIVVGAGGNVVVALRTSNYWYAPGGLFIDQTGSLEVTTGLFTVGEASMTIDGVLKTPSKKWDYSAIYCAGTITINETGVLELSGTGSDSGDYSTVTGPGTVKFQYVTNNNLGNWRAIPAPMFADTLSLVNEQADGLIFTNTVSTTIGSLSGTGVLRSDLNTSVTTRSVHIKQTVDGTWSGVFRKGDCIGTVYVEPGTSTSGTLTLAGDQVASNTANNESHDNNLQVESGASVNLTGTWVGATTVSGTFGGTGTLTGNLTFNAGSTFKANATALTVTGAVAFPAGPDAEVTVDLTGVTPVSGGTTLISSSTSMDSAINLTAAGAALKVVGNDLKAYPIVATYGGKNYATFADAIDVALADEGGEANLASITVVDATAELPAGYLIVDNHVIKAQGAIVDTNGTAHYYATAQAAVDAVDSYLFGTVYDYFAVYYGNDVDISINPSKLAWTYGGDVKVKCLNDSTVVVTLDSDEYTLDPSEPEDGIVTYSKIAVATTYVWVGATSDGDTSAAKQWDRPSNWRVGTSVGATASRSPSPIDTANLVGGAYVTGISVAESLTITGSGTLTSTGAISLTTSGATISVTGVTLDPAPTSGVDLMYVKATPSEGTTTYALQVAGEMDGTTAKIDDATAEVTVPASATAIEADPAVSSIKLEDGSAIKKSDITIKYNGTTDITGAFTVTVADNQVTIALNENGSVTISADTITVKPAVAASEPMTMPGATTAPAFSIKTIPGLYYVVRSGTDPSSLTAGSATQATTTTTGLAGTALGNAETVRYYQISVGRTAAEAAQ